MKIHTIVVQKILYSITISKQKKNIKYFVFFVVFYTIRPIWFP